MDLVGPILQVEAAVTNCCSLHFFTASYEHYLVHWPTSHGTPMDHGQDKAATRVAQGPSMAVL